MKSARIRLIAFTGVMIAITALFQSLRLIFPGLALINAGGFNVMQLVIGTLVNLCLLIAAWNAGLVSALLLSALTPVLAFMQGQMPIPHMIAVVALGNAVLCLIAWAPFARPVTRFVLTILAALAKFGVLALLVLKLVVPVLLPSAIEEVKKADAIAAALSAGFVWPQLFTAIAGGLIAFAISPRLPKVNE